MSARSIRTRRYVDRWALIGWWIPMAMLVLMLVGLTLGSVVLDTTVTVDATTDWTSEPMVLGQGLGAARIRAVADLQADIDAASFQVALVDADDEPLVEIAKEVWSEVGTWVEDGESGSWREDDLEAEWDVRGSAEPVRLEVSLVDRESGRPLKVHVLVIDGVVDMRWLYIGLGVSFALALLAFYAGGHGGRPVIVERASDSEVQGRAECGGAGRLVQVDVAALSDEHTPSEVRVWLRVRDANGTLVFADHARVDVRYRKDEGEIEDARVSARFYLELYKRSSYGFAVDISPDEPVEWTKLVVRDGASTRGEATVFPVSGDEVTA